MSRPSVPVRRRRRGFRLFVRNKRGASAVEFAIVAPVFFMLMFTTFEVGWFYFVNSTLDSAVMNAARVLRTGQVQKADLTKEEFYYNIVCPRVQMIGDCDSRLTVEVRTFASFAELSADSSPYVCPDQEQIEIDQIPYEPGADRSIVRLRMCILYNTLNPAIGMKLAQNEQGQRKVTTSYVLRVEPYSRNKNINPQP